MYLSSRPWISRVRNPWDKYIQFLSCYQRSTIFSHLKNILIHIFIEVKYWWRWKKHPFSSLVALYMTTINNRWRQEKKLFELFLSYGYYFSIFSNAISYYQNIFVQPVSTFAQRSGLFGNLKCLWSRWSFPLSLAIFWLTELNKTHNYWYAKCAWAWATTLQHAKISRAGIL